MTTALMPDHLLRLKNVAWWAYTGRRKCTPACMDEWPPLTEEVLEEIGAVLPVGKHRKDTMR